MAFGENLSSSRNEERYDAASSTNVAEQGNEQLDNAEDRVEQKKQHLFERITNNPRVRGFFEGALFMAAVIGLTTVLQNENVINTQNTTEYYTETTTEEGPTSPSEVDKTSPLGQDSITEGRPVYAVPVDSDSENRPVHAVPVDEAVGEASRGGTMGSNPENPTRMTPRAPESPESPEEPSQSIGKENNNMDARGSNSPTDHGENNLTVAQGHAEDGESQGLYDGDIIMKILHNENLLRAVERECGLTYKDVAWIVSYLEHSEDGEE